MPDGDPKLQEICQSTAADKTAMDTGLTAQDEGMLEEKMQPTQAVTESEVPAVTVENGNAEATVNEKRKEKKNKEPAVVARVQKNKTMGHLKDEELDWIWIGDADDARDAGSLRRHNVRYILNCTPLRSDGGVSNFHEKDPYFSYCRTSMGDNATEHLSKRFEESWEFLERARVREDGGVLVHCQQGVSRSASMVMSYLMKFYRKSFDEALALARNARAQANPNEGFTIQLKELETTLRTTNGYAKVPPTRNRANAVPLAQSEVQLRVQLEDQLRVQLEDQLRVQLEDQLRVQLEDQLCVQLGDQLWVQLEDPFCLLVELVPPWVQALVQL